MQECFKLQKEKSVQTTSFKKLFSSLTISKYSLIIDQVGVISTSRHIVASSINLTKVCFTKKEEKKQLPLEECPTVLTPEDDPCSADGSFCCLSVEFSLLKVSATVSSVDGSMTFTQCTR